MGNKRKNREEEEEKISKKIRKLQRKLHRRRRIISSDENESNDERQVLPAQSPCRLMSPEILSRASPDEEVMEMPSIVSPQICDPTPAGPSSAPDLVSTNIITNQEEDQLEEDILQILGEAPQPDVALGKNIHKDISARWQDILLKGLSKDNKDTIMKKYLIPANCHFLVAPLLNPEAKTALAEVLVKRDTTLLQKQNQIGVALAALSQVTEMILRNETSKQALLQPLSDACRILCDSHNIETKTRRSIIMSSINTTLREALTNTNRDKYLFGEDLAENLKIAKTVQKTGESLLRTNPVATSNKTSNYKNVPKNRNLNSRGPIQKKPPYRTNESSRGRTQTRPMRSAVTYSRPPPAHPPKSSSPPRRNYRR